MEKDPDILVGLTTARTDFEAEIMVQALEAQGIPAKAFTTAGAMLQWDIASGQPMRVMVRRRDLERAQGILRAVRAESVDIDWSEAEVGVAEPEEPPTPSRENQGWVATVRRMGMVLILVVVAVLSPLAAAAVFFIAAAVEFGFWKVENRRRERAGDPENGGPPATTESSGGS